MHKKKGWLVFLAVALIPVALSAQQSGHSPHAAHGASGAAAHPEEPDYPQLPGFGKKCWIGEEYYFTYQFDKRPQMGTVILKIQLFEKSGRRTTDLKILGDYGMPSMRGAHDSGDHPFQVNRKGDYLLPVSIVMAGEWEVKLTFLKQGKPIHRGSFRFTV